MKYAVISDVHGNLPALETVLKDAGEQGADGFIFAGDYCLSGPYPDECIDAMRAIPGAYVLRGNEETYLENLEGADPDTWTDGQMQISYYSFRNVRKENRDYLAALPHRIDLECNGINIHITHNKADFLGPLEGTHWRSSAFGAKYGGRAVTKEIMRREIHAENDSDETLQERIRELSDGVYIFGHTHVQWSYRSKDGRVILMNPGSCGLPLDCLPGTVPYILLEITEQGEILIDERRVAFDVESYVGELLRSEQFKQAPVWTKVIRKEILTGREHMLPFLMRVEAYAQSIGDERRPYTVETWEKGYEAWERETTV